MGQPDVVMMSGRVGVVEVLVVEVVAEVVVVEVVIIDVVVVEVVVPTQKVKHKNRTMSEIKSN